MDDGQIEAEKGYPPNGCEGCYRNEGRGIKWGLDSTEPGEGGNEQKKGGPEAASSKSNKKSNLQ